MNLETESAGEDEGYYSPRSDSTFASFSERSQALDDGLGRTQNWDSTERPRSQDASKQVDSEYFYLTESCCIIGKL